MPLLFPLILSLHVLSYPVTPAGGCRAHLWRQPATSAPAQAAQRRKTQVSGKKNWYKTVNKENVYTSKHANQGWNKYFPVQG